MPTLSLQSRIYIGFAILLSLLLANGLVSFLGLSQLRSAINSSQQINLISSATLTLDRDVQELRLRVDRYVASGHESLRDEVRTIHERLLDGIAAVQQQNPDPEMSLLFSRIQSHIDEYCRQFESVVEERRVRQDLFQSQLPAMADAVRTRLGALEQAARDGASDYDSRLALSDCRAEFSSAEKAFLRYFETPDTQFVNSAVNALEVASSTIGKFSDTAGAAEVVEGLSRFEQTGLRAVQATRSYLFFRNVVMAGEASEISYYASSLRALAKDRQDQIAVGVASTGNRVNQITGFTIAIAVVLAILIAGRLAYLILPPVTALTNTFTQLAEGRTLTHFPGGERADEIGRMARAARVFSDQNHQTRTLLEKSEVLAAELRDKAAELEATNLELDSFAYVASHDLKSPLRGIRQLAAWIEEDSTDQLAAESRNHLAQLQARALRLESLLQDLLEYSRVGRINPEPETVDVGSIMDGVVEITDNPSGVSIRYPSDLPTFKTLRAPLEQVLLNLVGNAVKHNHRGQEGWVEVAWRPQGDCFEVSVSDNGPGIDPKDHQRVFQMYQRVGDPRIEGSGMGLAIVKKQIEHMGGEVTLKSAPGEGAVFQFSWPTDLDSTTLSPA